MRELSKHYSAVAAVREVSFDVAAGEIFGLARAPTAPTKPPRARASSGCGTPTASSTRLGRIDALAHLELVKRLMGAQPQAATLQDRPRRGGRSSSSPRYAAILCRPMTCWSASRFPPRAAADSDAATMHQRRFYDHITIP